MRAYARRPELLVVTKSTSRSTVHRPGYLDYIGVKRFDAEGDVCGEHRFLGLYTSTAYSADPAEIPLLRRKTGQRDRAAPACRPAATPSKALRNILATYPRDELFQIAEDDLLRTAMGILHLGERQRFRLFVRRDPFERFLSCLIYAPRENYTTELRAEVAGDPDGGVQRHELGVQRPPVGVDAGAHHDHRAHDARARFRTSTCASSRRGSPQAARRWDDDLKEALIDALGEARGNELLRRFDGAFPAAYREDFAARAAVPDIEMMARLSDARAARDVALSAARGRTRVRCASSCSARARR